MCTGDITKAHGSTLLLADICPGVALEFEGGTSACHLDRHDVEEKPWDETVDEWLLDMANGLPRPGCQMEATAGFLAPPSIPPSPPITIVPSVPSTQTCVNSWLLAVRATRARTIGALLVVVTVAMLLAGWQCGLLNGPATQNVATVAVPPAIGSPLAATVSVGAHLLNMGWHCHREEGHEQRCYASPPVLTSHAGCSAVCEQHAQSTHGALAGKHRASTAALAFVGSRATSEFLRLHVLHGHKHWIGLYRRVLPLYRPHLGVHSVVGAAALHEFTSWAAERRSTGSAATQNSTAQGSAHEPPAHSPLTWSNWAHSQPDGVAGREDCVAIDGLSSWRNLGCGRAEYRCVCELDARTRLSYAYESAQLLDAADADAWKTVALMLQVFAPCTDALRLDEFTLCPR